MRRFCLALTVALSLWAYRLEAAPFYDPTYGVSVTSNIVYGTGLINNGAGTLDLLLDVYRPTDIGQPLPATSPGIVFIHGGSWTSGSKTEDYAIDFGNFYASLGYVVTSINYRLLGNNVPETHGPGDLVTIPGAPQPQTAYIINAGVEDASKAMGWMRDNAPTYNIDASHIAIAGASAGAFNSLLHAYNNPAPHVAPQAVVSYVGAMAGAESLIDAGEVPALLINGEVDPLVPPVYSQAVVDRMNSVGVYNEYYLQPDIGHDVKLDLVFGGQTLREHNVNFLAQFLVPEPSTFVLAALAAAAMVAFAAHKSIRSTPPHP